jgi:hypothetical protein
MISLDVQNQPQLPLLRCVELVVSGIRFRLMRAMITVAIIALAVAFLMTMLTESLTARRMARTIARQTAPRHSMLFWVNQLSSPITEREVMNLLARPNTDPRRIDELARWGQLPPAQIARLQQIARRQAIYADYFAGLTEAQKRILLGRARGMAIFPALNKPDALQRLESSLPEVRTSLPSLPADLADGEESPVEQLRQTVRQCAQVAPLIAAVRTGHTQRVEAFKAWLDGRIVSDVLAEPNEELTAKLTELDFDLDEATLAIVANQAALRRDARLIVEYLARPDMQERLDNYLPEPLVDLSQSDVLARIATIEGAKWLVAESVSLSAPLPFAPERIREVLQHQAKQITLAQVEADLAVATIEGGVLGFSGRTVWLLLVSLLVCAVGIANAMLMSVTERFREIATMKCLGATNRLIMISFVLESILQGVAGGLIGAVVGFGLGLMRGGLAFGWRVLGGASPGRRWG